MIEKMTVSEALVMIAESTNDGNLNEDEIKRIAEIILGEPVELVSEQRDY